jgi:hypothetical protein
MLVLLEELAGLPPRRKGDGVGYHGRYAAGYRLLGIESENMAWSSIPPHPQTSLLLVNYS